MPDFLFYQQHHNRLLIRILRTSCCHWYLKGKNFESNSQHVWKKLKPRASCHWYLKGKNFESNSQPSETKVYKDMCCHWYLKGKNFESNSQPISLWS